MRQFPFYLLAACLVSGAFFPAGSCRARVSSEGALQPAGAQAVQLDSLRSLADSLARAADSLGTLLDSLISPPEPAPGPASGKTPAIKNPWSGNFSMGLNLNRGNSDQRSLIASLRVSRKTDKTRFLSSATATNASGSQEKSTNKGNFKSKLEIEQNERIFYFVSFDMNYNRQAGLDLRLAPGAGV
ncbi:MAG: DUF481 domain-containing protein, partial [Candidatus Glassbacteria bacterium]|nr:DUF481 domain-containing protein [Candidatus Glassbacteria bacterium]